VSGTSPHHLNPQPHGGLNLKEPFLSRSPGASGKSTVASPSRRTPAALAASAVAALALLTPPAHAGEYTINQCSNGVTTGWTPNASGGGYVLNNCGAPGGGIGGTTVASAWSQAGWQFTVPADTTIWGFNITRDVSLPSNVAYGTGVFAIDTQGSGSGYANGYTNFGGIYYSGMVTDSAAWLTGQTGISLRINCSGGGNCSDGGGLGIHYVQITLSDAINPVIASASGSLLAGGALQGTKSISYGATDRGGGVYRAVLKLDGVTRTDKVIDSNGGNCAGTSSFTQPVPCKLSVSDTIALDTNALSEGNHSVQLYVLDATNTNQATYGPFTINVDNVPPPVNTSVPLITGIARHGQILAADAGTWTGTGITFARQWQRYDANSGTWTNIAGATAPTYAVQPADYGKSLRVRSRATNSEGSTDAYSDPCGPIASPTDPNGDLDGDGIPNGSDPDIDGDGVRNEGDANPNNPTITTPPGGNDSNGGGRDAGGGNGGGSAPQTQTQNGQGPVATAALAATFEGTNKKTITVKWGAKRRITGTLKGRNGQPIVGAKLDVTSTPQLMGAQPNSLGQIVTDAKGRFAYPLPAGVSRTIRFGYKSILEASTYTQTTEVVVQVIPKVTMKANHKSLRNKQAVTFKGKIAGAPAGARKVVELQALDGKKWRTFATTRVAKKGGTFTYRYRFTRTTRPTVYQFRAVVRAENGWPFSTGQAKALKVKVRG
jgi:hypothetical protein